MVTTRARHQRAPWQNNAPMAPAMIYCQSCNLEFMEWDWSWHISSMQHRRNTQHQVVRDAAEYEGGVTLTGTTDFGIIEAENTNMISNEFILRATVPSSYINVMDLRLGSSLNRNAASPFSVVVYGRNRTITMRSNVEFAVKFRSSVYGRFQDRLEILFDDYSARRRFMIVRPLRAIMGSVADHALLKPIAPYQPLKRGVRPAITQVIPGVCPEALKSIPWINKLPLAEIPVTVSSTLSHGPDNNIVDCVRTTLLPSILDAKTHSQFFEMLLWIEEYKLEQDLDKYDMHDRTMSKEQSYYCLAVPGLAEKRPSVLIGDGILVQRQDAPDGKWYEGRVHKVQQERVLLRFHASFNDGMGSNKYKVHFRLNRGPLRREHQALRIDASLDRIIFPLASHATGADPQTAALLHLSNPVIGQNPQQVQAITSIVHQPAGSIPFVLFGPPGTGKTVTIVESIRQILDKYRGPKILACAPSNSAADLVASGMTTLGSNALFRFYAPSRLQEQVPECLRSFTYSHDGHFAVPPMEILLRFRVIVSTCVSAAMLYGVGIQRGHFSHIFIDESGQASEPEVMIAIKTMADHRTNIVLSGDPKQLGSVIHSSIARTLGLGTSFLERLMQSELYDEKRGSPMRVVKLVNNYRSHKAILDFPNKQFYNGDLQPHGKANTINSFLGSPILVAKDFPVIFHALPGQDEREASSPSFFNIDEVTQVKRYIRALLKDKDYPIRPSEIGVITPYHGQCVKIRKALREFDGGLKVGSVEEFQGQERRVIVISTVRSSQDFIDFDIKHTLGFVASPRRFNVAITRAQALLIVVGDPSVLSLDPLWRSFLNYIYVHGGWTGVPPSWDPYAPVDEAGGYDTAIREAARRLL